MKLKTLMPCQNGPYLNKLKKCIFKVRSISCHFLKFLSPVSVGRPEPNFPQVSFKLYNFYL